MNRFFLWGLGLSVIVVLGMEPLASRVRGGYSILNPNVTSSDYAPGAEINGDGVFETDPRPVNVKVSLEKDTTVVSEKVAHMDTMNPNWDANNELAVKGHSDFLGDNLYKLHKKVELNDPYVYTNQNVTVTIATLGGGM